MSSIGSAVERLASSTSKRSRARKLAWLVDRIEPGATLLLVGVSVRQFGDRLATENFVESGLVAHADATALVYEAEGDPELGCPFVRGDALDLPFEAGSFDYVVSNAVIEHVGGPAQARQMVSESRRVARRKVFHTTPYRWFPVETHTQIPFLHWLPREKQEAAFAKVGKPWFNGQEFWLFGRNEFDRLAPGGVIHRAGPVSLVGEWPAV